MADKLDTEALERVEHRLQEALHDVRKLMARTPDPEAPAPCEASLTWVMDFFQTHERWPTFGEAFAAGEKHAAHIAIDWVLHWIAVNKHPLTKLPDRALIHKAWEAWDRTRASCATFDFHSKEQEKRDTAARVLASLKVPKEFIDTEASSTRATAEAMLRATERKKP